MRLISKVQTQHEQQLTNQSRRFRSRYFCHMGITLASSVFLFACSNSPEIVLRSGDFDDDDWPFQNFTEATLKCRNRTFGGVTRPLVTVTLNNTEYGLNGAAMGVGGYPSVRTYLKRDQWGAYVSTGDIVQRGLRLCE